MTVQDVIDALPAEGTIDTMDNCNCLVARAVKRLHPSSYVMAGSITYSVDGVRHLIPQFMRDYLVDIGYPKYLPVVEARAYLEKLL